MRQQFDTNLKGKKVAWAPVWLGVLESEWTRVMKDRFDDYGISLETRDANFKSDVQLQAVSDYINDKPDVIVVQNPNVTLLAKELKRAMDAGIYVVQVNMASNTLTDAYVGVDAKDMGRKIARAVIDECGGWQRLGRGLHPRRRGDRRLFARHEERRAGSFQDRPVHQGRVFTADQLGRQQGG